jgi:hypothetical protein
MSEESKPALAPEFLEGPWITAQDIMEWFSITKECLKTWRYRGKIAYSDFGGTLMYNKAWIQHMLAQGWTWKQPKPGKKKGH